jgi:hypothetical protein
LFYTRPTPPTGFRFSEREFAGTRCKITVSPENIADGLAKWAVRKELRKHGTPPFQNAAETMLEAQRLLADGFSNQLLNLNFDLTFILNLPNHNNNLITTTSVMKELPFQLCL